MAAENKQSPLYLSVPNVLVSEALKAKTVMLSQEIESLIHEIEAEQKAINDSKIRMLNEPRKHGGNLSISEIGMSQDAIKEIRRKINENFQQAAEHDKLVIKYNHQFNALKPKLERLNDVLGACRRAMTYEMFSLADLNRMPKNRNAYRAAIISILSNSADPKPFEIPGTDGLKTADVRLIYEISKLPVPSEDTLYN